MVSAFEDYRDRYGELRMERHDGVLEVTFHSDGAPLRWCERVHRELPGALTDIGNDPDNRVVILTGAGDTFCTDVDRQSFGPIRDGHDWYKLNREGRVTLAALLQIDAPVIAAVNGPVSVHSELLMLSDIVLSTPNAWFQDTHLERGTVPGDGVHVAWSHVLGPSRARYLLTSGQRLSAQDALEAGAVHEILPAEALLDRARELAASLLERSPLALRITRLILAQPLKQLMLEGHAHGSVHEGLAKFDGRFR